MFAMITIKVDPRMKKALERLAEKDFSNLSSIMKKAADEYLSKNGIDWRKEKVSKK